MNGVQYFFSIVFSFNLRNYIFQSAKKCEMTSFYMTSLHVELNEAAKCVDIIPWAEGDYCGSLKMLKLPR